MANPVGFIETTKTMMLEKAQEQKFVHPFRFKATDALTRVLWMASVELDAENRTCIVNLIKPKWSAAKFPVTLELEDARGARLVANVSAPEREYLQ